MTEPSEPRAGDVEALAKVIRDRVSWASLHWGTEDVHPDAWPNISKAILASDWFAGRIAEAEQRGREDNADHGMCYVSGSKALAARDAVARREGAAEARLSGWAYRRGNTP